MKTCEICGKGSKMVGKRIKLRGHYNPTNWSRKYPNLQKTTTPKGEKTTACVQCIKTFSKPERPMKKRVLEKIAELKEKKEKEKASATK